MRELALYIHLPFCQSKCYYCDFCSYPCDNNFVGEYIRYLKKEIDLYSNMLMAYTIKTIFIGGGTPSYIDGKHISEILNHINKKFVLADEMEISLEANPKTFDKEKLRIYKDSGVNRISLGVQTLKDDLLLKIGRIHTKKDFLEAYKLVRNTGFDNVNIDIMFNLPNQTIEDVENTIKEIVDLDVEHISLYSLKIEEGTKFYEMEVKNQLELPSEDDERRMYHRGIKILEGNNYEHYEISNFAKKGFQCKHNMFYWTLKPYVGIGLAAHSNINRQRYENTKSFHEYYKAIDNENLPIIEADTIDITTEISEYMILGLRLIDGIKKDNFKHRFGKELDDVFGDKLATLQSKGLLTNNSDTVRLTLKGLDLSNRVFIELL